MTSTPRSAAKKFQRARQCFKNDDCRPAPYYSSYLAPRACPLYAKAPDAKAYNFGWHVADTLRLLIGLIGASASRAMKQCQPVSLLGFCIIEAISSLYFPSIVSSGMAFSAEFASKRGGHHRHHFQRGRLICLVRYDDIAAAKNHYAIRKRHHTARKCEIMPMTGFQFCRAPHTLIASIAVTSRHADSRDRAPFPLPPFPRQLLSACRQ